MAEALGTDRLTFGTRVAVSGGYFYPPSWLSRRTADDVGDVLGTVVGQVESEYGIGHMVVRLDQPLPYEVLVYASPDEGDSTTAKSGVATHVVLALRYAGAQWRPSDIVGVYLLDEFPVPDAQVDPMSHAAYAESHAVYRALGQLN